MSDLDGKINGCLGGTDVSIFAAATDASRLDCSRLIAKTYTLGKSMIFFVQKTIL